jgi:hypothetical protein
MRYGLRCFGKALLAVAAVAVLGWLVMALWNTVITTVFVDARSIDYLHALGLLILSRILFGGFRGRGGCGGRRHWRKWEAMTPEEREQFKQSKLSRRGQRSEE